MLVGILVLIAMVFLSSFFSMAEISLSSARKMKLQVLADEGNKKALKVLALQEKPGRFFSTIQVGVNIAAVVAGIVSDSVIDPFFTTWFSSMNLSYDTSSVFGSILSFIVVTSFVIEFADLIPKRIALVAPEKISMSVVGPISVIAVICTPFIVIFDGFANILLKLFRVPSKRDDNITYEDISAVMDAGAEAGVVDKKEHHLIENVFELETRWVPSAMTQRDDIVYFTLTENEESISNKILTTPHSKFLICEDDLDDVVGYIASKDILPTLVEGGAAKMLDKIKTDYCKKLLIIPNTLTLSEALDTFNEKHEDFAVILNEYGHVVGIITLDDVMTTLLGAVVAPLQDELIIKRDEDSWLIDGMTPIEDVIRVLDIEEFPEQDSYETLAGFIMFCVKAIPKKAAKVEFGGYIFEVMDVDNHKIDQILVTKKTEKAIEQKSVQDKS